MADHKNDVSPEHFGWLVARRSENQSTTLKLYAVLFSQEAKINRNPKLYDMAQALTGVAFSLWRAVFLSDLTDDVEKHLEDLNKFLISLIADNSVQYQTDKNARNWSFAYYLENAEFRLELIAQKYPNLLPDTPVNIAAASEKDRWSNAQRALDVAVAWFALTAQAVR